MGTAMRTGHYRLPDGELLRVDFEMGRWVGTLYAPSMTIKTQIVGSDAHVHAWGRRLRGITLPRHQLVRRRLRTNGSVQSLAFPKSVGARGAETCLTLAV
ncbi:MAG: hypothetical protein QOD10_5938 [Mycobacterium sp.]|jgi:hypothetical protein|nr:hypothetical protein [Mycobacterium sp.]